MAYPVGQEFAIPSHDLISLSPSDSRLIEITNLALNPPREPTPEPEGGAVTTDEVPSTASITGPSEHGGAVIGLPESIAASNSFHFMQDSELEGPFDDTPAEIPQQTLVTPEAVAEADASASVNGHADAEAPVVSATIDVCNNRLHSTKALNHFII
jgi:hypothetical protein